MGLLSALASGVESYATGRVKELDQQREFDMKKEMVAIEAEKAAMIDELKAKRETARADETFKRARDRMGPETEDYQVGDAKNVSVMGGYTDDAGVFHPTEANTPATAQREVPLGERLKRGLLDSIKAGDAGAYDAINTVYGNMQKIDKADKDLSAAEKPTLTDFDKRLALLKGLKTPAEKVEAWALGTSEKSTDDPYRETPEQKASREDAKAAAEQSDEALKAEIVQEFKQKRYPEWKKLNFQGKFKDFLDEMGAEITQEFVKRKKAASAVSDTSGMRPSGGPPKSGRGTSTIKVNPALKIH